MHGLRGQWPAMRWGNGIGGWERDQLYVTNRIRIYVLEMGIEGKKSVTNP